MLNACELADDLERAAQWCQVADEFVATYGCPFLYAECRIYYGSVLAAKGRWEDAEREMAAGLRITDGACPGLHAKAVIRLAALRIRQGRLEDADQLLAHLTEELGESDEAETEAALSVAALLLARGDAPAAARHLEHRLRQAGAASLAAGRRSRPSCRRSAGCGVPRPGGCDGGQADRIDGRHGRPMVGGPGDGRPGSGGDGHQRRRALELLESARQWWSRLELPFEAARTRVRDRSAGGRYPA